MKGDGILEGLELETVEDLRKFLKDFFKDEKVEIYYLAQGQGG